MATSSTVTAEDWALDWGGLPGYPALPRLFTNAKTAKKRRHRECAAASSEADLDRVVKLPRRAAGATATAAAAAAGAQQQAAATAGDQQPSAGKLSKAERKAQKLQRAAAVAAAGATAEAAAEPKAAAAAQSKKAAKQVSKQLAGEAPGDVAAADAAPESSSGKKRTQATQQGQSNGDAAAAVTGAPVLPKKSRRNKFKQQERVAAEQQQAQQQQPAGGGAPQAQQEQRTHKKQQKQQHAGKTVQPPPSPAAPARAQPAAGASAQAGGSSGGGSKLLQQFKERLQGSRFRQLNEALYTQPGAASFSSMQSEPELFSAYHEGFQQQVKAWPQQPLDAAISWLQGRSSDLVVADFGCGEAQLAASVKQTVHSLDLVATAPGVIACNMAHTPLKTGSCDVAVFSLALMGTDYGSFLVEAARVLKPGGWLWVAEVRSRFAGTAAGGGGEDFKPFLAALQQLGFKLASQDASNRMFVVWVLRKGKHGAGGGSGGSGGKGIRWPKLKACVYKKR